MPEKTQIIPNEPDYDRPVDLFDDLEDQEYNLYVGDSYDDDLYVGDEYGV